MARCAGANLIWLESIGNAQGENMKGIVLFAFKRMVSTIIIASVISVDTIGCSKQPEKGSARSATVLSWKGWKDPLGSDKEIDWEDIGRKEAEARRLVGEKTREALKPMIVPATQNKPMTLPWGTFGGIGSVRTNSSMYVHNGVVREYFPSRKLDNPYFAFDNVTERRSPKTHRLHTLSFAYQDYGHGVDGWPCPLGRFHNGADLLAEGRAVLADLSTKMGTQLQEFRLTSPVWPYRPGVKMSRMWSGPIAECYLCDESAWITSRHAVATSSTIIGRLSVKLNLKITYYDEYSMCLDISDCDEVKRSEAEFQESLKEKGSIREKGSSRRISPDAK